MGKINLFHKIASQIDNNQYHCENTLDDNAIDYIRILPFIFLHMGCFLVFWVGVSPIALMVALFLYFLRVFALTGFYHRYFSHKAFKTTRGWQCIFAIIGATAAQRGALWWASHHRNHHRYSDQPGDHHSPTLYGFWSSHIRWFLVKKNFITNEAVIPDLMKFPELVFLNRFDTLVPLCLAGILFFSGWLLNITYPDLETSGFQLLIWGFFISTVAVMHTTFSINSIAHRFGGRRYKTKDNSRNNFWLALLSFGEGWHNNHHHFPGSARQGFFWWEIDFTYYILKFLSWAGIIWDLREVPKDIKLAHQRYQEGAKFE